MNRSFRRHAAVLLVLASFGYLVACRSDGAQPAPSTKAAHTLSYPYSFKYYVKNGSTMTLAAAVPAEVALAAQVVPATNAAGLHALDVTVATGNDTTTPMVVTGPDDLLAAAAAQCGMVGDTANQLKTSTDPTYAAIASMENNNQVTPTLMFQPPWQSADTFSTAHYYIFDRVPGTCDNVLEYEETLVCIADQLTELADTVAPLTWYAGTSFVIPTGSSPAPPVLWIIPPPDEASKFIVRDLALDVLAHVPMMDAYPYSWLAPVQNTYWSEAPSASAACMQLYALYENTGEPAAYETLLFGASPAPAVTYPPNPATSGGGGQRTIVQERQAFEAGVLRAAGQLMHDIVRESVYSDLAGAAAVGETAGDQAGGQTLSFDLTGNQPYNSLGHVARTLLGRLDMALTGSLVPFRGFSTLEEDPQCQGVTELGLLPNRADQGMIARAKDLGALTGNQALAETLFEESGLVITDGASIDVAGALLDQLLAIKATTLGTPAGTALSNLVGTLTASDLSRAVQHNSTTFSIITNSPTNLSANALQAAALAARLNVSSSSPPCTPGPGCIPPSMPANPALGSSGIAIVGGLPRALAQTDPVARSGPMMVASQCAETMNVIGAGDSLALILAGAVPPPPAEEYPQPNPAGSAATSASMPAAAVRQDVFAAAGAIRGQLVKLRQYADNSVPTTSTSSVDAKARAAAVAELGAWAGTGRAILTTSARDSVISGPPAQVLLNLVGVLPTDFGVQQASAIAGQISLVYNDSHLAECAANLTATNCTSAAVNAARWLPDQSSSTVSTVSASSMATDFGATASWVTVAFDASTAPANLSAQWQTNVGNFGFANPFYVVLSQDPAKPAGTGAVLGAIALAPAPSGQGVVLGSMSLALSPMRRELLYDAFGLGKWVGAAPPQAGELPTSGTPSFCVEGVPRDIFVPLQNDLTDSSDSYENSWSHYLSLAQEAATNADTLANQLVDIGFQNTTNVENATEQLLTKTGTLPNASEITIDANGNINAGPDNGVLNTVLTQPTFDVVFFGTAPTPANLPTALGCTQNPGNPLCVRLNPPAPATAPTVVQLASSSAASWTGPASPNTFTYTALGLVSPPISNTPNTFQCAGVTAGALAMKGITATSGGASYSSSTLFQNGPFTRAVNGLTNAEQSFINGLSQTQMTMDDNLATGHWKVTYGGNTIMDSDAPGAWPACLRSVGTGDPCGFTTSPNIAAFNDLFRWCPNADLRETPLGECDGVADAELNGIRWRVEAALWLAAAMSGDIPAGMFTGPMPAANFPADLANPDSVSAPVNMVFANGTFNTRLGLGETANLSSSYGNPDPGEAPALLNNPLGPPVAVDPTSRYFQWGPNGSQQVPIWLLTVYSQSAANARVTATGGSLPFTTGDNAGSGSPPYVHIMGSTPDGTSDYSNLNPFFSLPNINLGGISNQVPASWWGTLAGLLDKKQCAAPTGDGQLYQNAPTAFGPAWLQGLVASLKTQQSQSSDMRSPFTFNSANNWGEWKTTYEWTPPALDCLGQSNTCTYGTGAFAYFTLGDLPVAQPFWFDQVPVRWHYTSGGLGSSPSNNDFLSPDSQTFGIIQRDPTNITPAMRLQFALNSGAPNGGCDAAWQLTQAMALSCLLGFDVANNAPSGGTATEPQTLQSVDDLIGLSGYVDAKVQASALALQSAYVAGVPASAVASALNLPGALSSTTGSVGQDLVQVSNALLAVYTDWGNVQMHARSIANGIDAAREAIVAANVSQDQTALSLDIENLNALKAIADDTITALSGAASFVAGFAEVATNPAQGVNTAIGGATNVAMGIANLSFDSQVVPLIAKLQSDDNENHTNQINAAITNLNQEVNVDGTAMTAALTSLRQDVGNISAGTAALATDRATTAYYAGKASGADVWNCNGPNGQTTECLSHVNTVLNRRYDGTALRYADALKNAKGLAYLARLSIEQRLGTRLSSISTPIGTLDPPATWADDVCHLTGVNYTQLANELPDAGSSTASQQTLDQSVASQFADAFIGDYVQKLTDFVNYYNVTYPEQDGNDTAVLSLRETLLGGNPQCLVPSTNMLVDSSMLYSLQAPPSSTASPTGWARNVCSLGDVNCLQVEALPGLQLPSLPGGASWLVDSTRPADQDGGVDVVNVNAITGGPDDVESQQVLINAPGMYVLSWWDEAIDPIAVGPAMAAVPAYQVGVYDATWKTVGGLNPLPSVGGWSGRQVLTFPATQGVYYVVFGASASNSAPGSVAIANVQLELGTSVGTPSAYQDTSSSGQMTAFDCAVSPAQLQSAFTHNCDPDGTCHYDLNVPLTINTQTMSSNGMSLAGKLATGNYNFRHIDVAVNVVGTGVIDCTSTGSPDCYGSGFLQYTLTDDGSNVGVLGFDGQYRNFDFGIASISRAKAVTAERYITTPVGSSDQALINQFLQTQFRGRPIDGVYRLQIYDTPALQFRQLQDVQIILNYHYWSSVITTNNSN